MDSNSVLKIIWENTYLAFPYQLNKFNKPLESHPLPIEKDSMGVVVLEESPNEGSMYNIHGEDPTINCNCNIIVILYIKENWPTLAEWFIIKLNTMSGTLKLVGAFIKPIVNGGIS